METAESMARAHRRDEAARGFPLLRGCPSTFVLRRLAERAALLERLPLVARAEAQGPGGPDLRFQPVKSLARLAAEPGGIEGFARMQGLEGAAAEPPAPHVPEFGAAVPVPPAKLRKATSAALTARFGGAVAEAGRDLAQLRVEVPRGRMVLTLDFAGKGWGAMSRQMSYSLWADLDGVRMVPTCYEALWLLPAQWNLLTPGNLDAAAAHLVRLVEARLALGVTTDGAG